MLNGIKIIFILYIILIQNAVGQYDSTFTLKNQQPNGFRTGFEKNINTFKWIADISYNNTFNKYEFFLKEQFNSNLIKTKHKLYKDEQNITLIGKYKISNPLKFFSRLNSLIISDNLETGMSNISTHSLLSGFEYIPTDYLRIEPALGYRADKQMNESDAGLSYYLKFGVPNLEIQGYNNYLEALIQRDNLIPRKLDTRYIYFSNRKNFFQNTYNTLSFLYKNFRRDFYFYADSTVQNLYSIKNNIEIRNENLITLNDSLRYDVGSKFSVLVSGNIFYRTIEKSIKYKTARDFDNQIKDFKIYGATNISFLPFNFLSGNIELLYGERNVTHFINYEEGRDQLIYDKFKNIESQKNNFSRRTSFSGNFFLNLTGSHKISFSSSNSILRYDTPSKLNDDDRDELWTVYNITTYHKISKYLNIRLPVDANLVHIVYLSGTRSGNNNWNRILKFAPQIDYTPSNRFSSTNIAEVLANYTTFDFENADFPLKSYVFRQFAFLDSSRYRFTERISFTFYGKLIYYERGELNWRAFKSKPSNFNEDKTIICQIQAKHSENLLLTFGIRYFTQKRYKYEGRNKYLENMLISVGPTASIDYSVNSKFILALSGWTENIKYTNTKPRISTNIIINLNRTL